jgi:hypothetical protein
MKRHKTAFKLPIQQNKFLFPSLRNMTLNPFADYDKDGVNNAIDCRPFNRRFQDAKPNWMQRERLSKTPIFVTDRPISYDNPQTKSFYPLTSKKAPREAQRKVYSMLKKYPSLTGDIEKQRPRAILFTTGGITDKENILPYPIARRKGMWTEGFASETPHGKVTPEQRAGSGVAVIDIRNEPFYKKPERKYDAYNRTESARATAHELEHIRQKRVGKKRPKLLIRWSKGTYANRAEEQKAREAEEELERKTPVASGLTEREWKDEPNEEGEYEPKPSAVQRIREKISSGIKYVTSGGNEE